MYQNKNAGTYQNRSAGTFQNKNAETYPNKSARMFQNKNAEMYPNKSAGTYQNKSAVMYQNKSAVTYQNKNARMYQNKSAEMYPSKSVKNSASRYCGAKSALDGEASLLCIFVCQCISEDKKLNKLPDSILCNCWRATLFVASFPKASSTPSKSYCLGRGRCSYYQLFPRLHTRRQPLSSRPTLISQQSELNYI